MAEYSLLLGQAVLCFCYLLIVLPCPCSSPYVCSGISCLHCMSFIISSNAFAQNFLRYSLFRCLLWFESFPPHSETLIVKKPPSLCCDIAALPVFCSFFLPSALSASLQRWEDSYSTVLGSKIPAWLKFALKTVSLSDTDTLKLLNYYSL